VAREVASDDHFDAQRLAALADGYVGVGVGEQPIGADVARGVQEIGRYLVEHRAFVRNRARQDVVECGDAVAGDHHEQVAAEAVHVADFATVKGRLAGELEVGFAQRGHFLVGSCRLIVVSFQMDGLA
jgi:hypothetical protein